MFLHDLNFKLFAINQTNGSICNRDQVNINCSPSNSIYIKPKLNGGYKHNFFKNSPFSSRSLQLAFAIRIFSSLVVYFLYSYYYPVRAEADTFKYFDDSYHMSKAFWSHPNDFFQMLIGIDCNTAYFHDNYFNDMSNWVRSYDNGLLNDNRLVIRFNAFLRIFSFGNYHIHTLIFNFIAFIGSVSMGNVFYAVSKSKLKSYLAVFINPLIC